MASRVHTAPASSCNSSSQCCGRRATMQQMERRATGFGPVNQAPVVRKPTPVQKPPERRPSAERRKSLPKVGSERARETSPQAVYEKLAGENCDGCRGFSAGDLVEPESDHMKKIPKCSRDKESLLEECLDLKNAMADQTYHLKLHKVHHESVNLENRKMEMAIEELESSNGLEAPRTGGASRLKAKLQGLKARQEEYHATLETQRDDLQALKKDPRIAFTQEATVERDVFATETGRLQKMVRRLRSLYHRICAENNEVARLREKIAQLTSDIEETTLQIKNKKDLIEKMKKDIQKEKDAAEQAKKDAKNASRKLKELQDHCGVLKDMLNREKVEQNRMTKRTRQLQEQARQFEKVAEDRKKRDALDKARALAAKNQKGKKGKKKKTKAPRDKSEAGSEGASDADSGSFGSDDIDPGVLAAQEEFLGAVTSAAETFVDEAPASRPNSPKAKSSPSMGSEGGDHSEFEGMRDKFTKRVEDAEDKFLSEMEKLEYGRAQPGSRGKGMTPEEKAKLDAERKAAEEKISAAEKAKLAAEAEAKRLAAEAKAAQDEARRLAAELEALKRAQGGGSGGKRWQKEKMTIQVDNKELKPGEYTSEVQDKGSEISISVKIKSPTGADDDARRRAEEEAKRRAEEEAKRRAEEAKRRAEEEAKRRAEEEAKRRAEEAKRRAEEEAKRRAEEEAKRRAEEESKRKAQEDARKKAESADDAKRRAEEEARRKKLEEEEARRRKAEQDEAAKRKASFDAQKKKMTDELEEARRRAAEEEARRKAAEAGGSGSGEFFDPAMQGVIKENIKEVLEHLETISETVQQKASSSGTAESAAKDVLKKLD